MKNIRKMQTADHALVHVFVPKKLPLDGKTDAQDRGQISASAAGKEILLSSVVLVVTTRIQNPVWSLLDANCF